MKPYALGGTKPPSKLGLSVEANELGVSMFGTHVQWPRKTKPPHPFRPFGLQRIGVVLSPASDRFRTSLETLRKEPAGKCREVFSGQGFPIFLPKTGGKVTTVFPANCWELLGVLLPFTRVVKASWIVQQLL